MASANVCSEGPWWGPATKYLCTFKMSSWTGHAYLKVRSGITASESLRAVAKNSVVTGV